MRMKGLFKKRPATEPSAGAGLAGEEASATIRDAGTRKEFRRSRWDWRGPMFFFGVPLALALVTVTTSGYSETLGYGWAFLYVSHLSLIPWWIAEFTTRFVHFCLRSYCPKLWLVCSLGILLACLFVGPFVFLVSSIFERIWEGAGLVLNQNHTSETTSAIVIQVVRAIFFWTAANYFFDRFLGYPRFRNHETLSEEANRSREEVETNLLRKLNLISSLSEIVLVKAEEHYVRVESRETHEFITYRFSSALQDLKKEEGFQVHRSFWVRKSAVVGKHTEGRQLSLEMTNGSIVPVSRPYHALIRQVF